MPQQLVFITLFLGLISGPMQIDLQGGAGIRSVRILLDGHQVAEIRNAPWSATVDFGPQVVPGELVATGYDEQGQEVARVSQLVNLPHPMAEFVIVLHNNGAGVPASAELRWEHLLGTKPAKATLTIDDNDVSLDSNLRANLPPLEMAQPHVIAAMIRFQDDFVARREMVVGGTNGDTAETQLTPIAVRGSTNTPTPTAGCFTNAGAPVRTAAIEKSPGLVIVVLDPDHHEALRTLDPTRSMGMLSDKTLRQLSTLDRGTSMHILWTVAERFQTTSTSASILFPMTDDIDGSEQGLVWLLRQTAARHRNDSVPRQPADAVGAAGLNAMTGAHRRAVVLVLSKRRDASTHSAAASRKYLASIGVPLFVWSLEGPRPELSDMWGDIEEVSSLSKLREATDRVRAELASQRVAWVAADPLAALRVQPAGQCGLTPLAHESR